MARIVVTGYMLRHPIAGNLAAFFQYVLGLHRLGHEVLYLEEKGWDGSAYDPVSNERSDFPHAGLRLARELSARHCPEVRLVFVDAQEGTVDGASWDELKAAIARADLMIDVGGMCWLEECKLARRRVLVDMDPVFTQAGRFGGGLLDDFQLHFSYGTNLGQEECSAPTAGVDWLPTVPPVVPELWSVPAPRPQAPFTTIANWGAYGSITRGGVSYGDKDGELRRLLDLPARVGPGLELAVSGADARTRGAFREAGWRVRNGGEVTATVDAYRAYIGASQAELSAAKHGYVVTRSGWFSDRTVCYLAAGRPAVVQDTGFRPLPAAGLLTFDDPDEAAEQVKLVHDDLERHSAAARELARSVFDYRVVLPALLERSLELSPMTAAVA